jgi:hypothetical protein
MIPLVLAFLAINLALACVLAWPSRSRECADAR